jgi:hypothetical protein
MLAHLSTVLECVPVCAVQVVSCQQVGLRRAAEDLSAAYVIMYLGMLVTLLIYVACAIRIVGPLDLAHADGQASMADA